MTAKILEPPSDAQALIRTAFRLLLAQDEEVSMEDLVAATGIKRERLTEHLDEFPG